MPRGRGQFTLCTYRKNLKILSKSVKKYGRQGAWLIAITNTLKNFFSGTGGQNSNIFGSSDHSGFIRVREKSGKFKFFQGQGIVREFNVVSGKNEFFLKCQGILKFLVCIK